MFVFFDGKICAEHEAQIPISDRGFLFGDGIFTSIRVSNGVPEFLDEHLRRLHDQCHEIGIEFPLFEPSIINQLIQKNRAVSGVWRLKIIVTGGSDAKLLLDARKGRMLITLQPHQMTQTPPLRVITYPTPVIRPSGQLKSLSYLDRFLVKKWAADQGYDDAITIDEKGNLLEASFSNLFWIYQDIIYTPNPTGSLLKGVALDQLVKKLKLPVEYANSSTIPQEACPYLINSVNLHMPIGEWNGKLYSNEFNQGVHDGIW